MSMSDTAYLVDGKYGIRDLVDLDELKRIFERFTEATGFTIGLLDHPGLNILIGTGWRDICTKFHRACPVAADNCTRSNRRLLDQLDEPGKLVVERCDNGLVDCAFPIIVKGKHIASLATGQLLFEEPDVEWFRQQAKRFGIAEHDYLRALEEVPVVSEEKLRSVTVFLGEMALLLSELGYAQLTAIEEGGRLEREVSIRKQAEESLRASEDIFRNFMEYSPMYVFFKDENARSLRLSKNYETMLGRPLADLLGKNMDDLFPSELARNMVADDMRILKEGKPIVIEEEFNDRFYWTLKFPIFSEGVPRYLAGYTMDITVRKQADAEREKLRADFEHAQKIESVGRLAGGVAHDFNNMLGVILGHTEMALDRVDASNPLYEDLTEIRKAALRSAALTKKLLAFGRKQTISPRVLDLNETVAGMLNMLQRLIGENIELAWLPAEDLWPVRVDPSQVDQILANLCVNARDAISGIGKLTIETECITLDEKSCTAHPDSAPGEYVILTVSDNGCGMDEATRSHLFEPFFTTKEMGKGTGLGLATVFGIARQNNGFISVGSEPGQGTVVKIFLPRYAGEAENVSGESKAGPVIGGHETILLVEDEPSTLRMITVMLQRQGYTVLAAVSADEAIRLAREHAGEIQLLMTDVIMPRMNGRDLAKHLLALYPEVKCLFVSGYTANVIAHHGMLDEHVHFLQKPFDMHSLAASVRKALDEPVSRPIGPSESNRENRK
jgi:PAS domain S-box-containing protein